jgi:hypothetical protein
VLAVGFLLCAPAASEGAGTPQLGSAWTSGVGTTAASLRTEVNPNGLDTTYHFSYISGLVYQENLSQGKDGFAGSVKVPPGAGVSIGSGTAAVTVSQAIGVLSPDTSYRYRVEAANSAGTATGPPRLFTTEAFAGPSILLDDRGWEIVSPLDKNGGQIQGFGASFGGGTIQAAADGSALTFSSLTSFGADAAGAPAASQYIARRGAGGWVTENITALTVAGAYGEKPNGVPYQLFSADLGRALLLNGNRCEVGESCPRSYSLLDPGAGSLGTSPAVPDLSFAGAGPGLGQIILSTCAALTDDATMVPLGVGCDQTKPNLYRWAGGPLSLVNILPAGAQGSPGASLASQAGAVSNDGQRVYWTLAGNLYLREGATSKQVDAAVGGEGAFETASKTGSVAYFTKAGHLYRYDAPTAAVTDLTPAGGVQGVLGASESGAYVYYVTSSGVFVRHGSVVSEVAENADASNYPAATGVARVTPDGTHLAFLSKASLTGYDNRDAGGSPLSEVFIYDAATDGLVCASCNPTGERPLGPSGIPGAIANGTSVGATHAYKPRAFSDDGRRLFFDSADAISPADTAKRPDVYEWEAQGSGSCQRQGGCIALISAGRGSEGASFLDASASGADAFFLTGDSLVGADNGFVDVYDAREGGGFPEPPKPIECAGDACQFLPSQPEDLQPGTLVPGGGNPPLRVAATSVKCKRGFVRKRGRCVKRRHWHKARSNQKRKADR